MKISDYQEKLILLEMVEGVEITPMSLGVWMAQNNVKGELKLCEVTTLTRFDMYYTSYERHDEKTTYRRTYNKMSSYDYPMKNPSYNNGELPLVPHVFDGKEYHRLPNEVIMTLSEDDSDFK